MTADIGHPSRVAAVSPDRPAVICASGGQTLSYGVLEDRSLRLANALRSYGLVPGDHVALLLENRPEVFEIVWGALRCGLYVTPVNWHLTADEASYIIEDCGARVLFAGDEVAAVATAAIRGRPVVGVAVGASQPGFNDYERVLELFPPTPDPGECEGAWMFYSAGTTGRPKGIKPQELGGALGAPVARSRVGAILGDRFGASAKSVYLSPAPLYHAAPAGWTTAFQRLGATVVITRSFDPVELLELIERFEVTHVQLVPTHLVRLLRLPPATRQRYDLSSLKVLVHAAAPCPVEVKRAVIEWLGPIVHEYYAGSEGAGMCAIDSDEWLARPGSVGRSLFGPIHVLAPDGTELPPGQEGQVWFESTNRFEYHHSPEQTAAAHDPRGWSTLGDIGRLDEDGYLYLTDRVANTIITGGVNVYPREVEDVLIVHPAVEDVAVVGVPDDDFGESVRAVVQLAGDGDRDTIAVELMAFCRSRIAVFKCPRSIVFVDQLPRLPTGKLAKRLLPAAVLRLDTDSDRYRTADADPH
jgi:acyl-CoA synthetase (AMP-forming)/AMP-acid ligase II